MEVLALEAMSRDLSIAALIGQILVARQRRDRSLFRQPFGSGAYPLPPPGRRSLIKVLYCFHQNNDDSKCEVAHTSLPIRPSKSPQTRDLGDGPHRMSCPAGPPASGATFLFSVHGSDEQMFGADEQVREKGNSD